MPEQRNKPSLRQRIGLWLAGASAAPARRLVQQRMYQAARPSRFNVGLGQSTSSADAELANSLTRLRASSRQLVRDASYAKRAKTLVVNNVIGPGIGLQAQVKTTRGELHVRANDDIERAWCEWSCADSCHTGGAMHFSDLERAAMGQVFEAGEVFIRMHTKAFGQSKVRLALEFIEPERIPSDYTDPSPRPSGAMVRMGVELDSFGRAVAYYIRNGHPGDVRALGNRADQYDRVPANEVFHLRIVDRWPQTRGEPWMHTVIRKLDSIDQYSQAELQAAQADATQFATLETAAPGLEGSGALANNQLQQDAGEKPEIQIENGVVQELAPGETLKYHQPVRPNTALDPFLRYMLREVAAGCGVSYESLSRDYSQTTYSSGRLAILDDRDTWRVLQMWWLRNFRMPLHKAWVNAASLSGALSAVPPEQYMPEREKFEAVKFKPRGWSWVDPVKEVNAYKEAEKAGYISAEDIIAQTANGLDIEDVVDGIKRSRELYEEAGIVRDTDVAATNAAKASRGTGSAAPQADPEDGDPPDPDAEDGNTPTQNDPPSRVVSLARTK